MDKDLSRLQTELAAVLAGLDARQTQATPAGSQNKWSIQQIVEHLLMTFRVSASAVRLRLEKRTATRAKPSLRQVLGQAVLLRLRHFPAGREAPAAVSPSLPTTIQSGSELTTKLACALREFDSISASGDECFGDVRAVSHPILGPLSMSQWRRFHLVHGLHHVAHVRAIRRDHGFRSAASGSSSKASSTRR